MPVGFVDPEEAAASKGLAAATRSNRKAAELCDNSALPTLARDELQMEEVVPGVHGTLCRKSRTAGRLAKVKKSGSRGKTEG